jgi:hypothetical protein
MVTEALRPSSTSIHPFETEKIRIPCFVRISSWWLFSSSSVHDHPVLSCVSHRLNILTFVAPVPCSVIRVGAPLFYVKCTPPP